MDVRISTTKVFLKNAKHLQKRYKSIKSDLKKFGEELRTNPLLGTDLGGGMRKIRMAVASKGKGKSGGARIITYTVKEEGDTAYSGEREPLVACKWEPALACKREPPFASVKKSPIQ